MGCHFFHPRISFLLTFYLYVINIKYILSLFIGAPYLFIHVHLINTWNIGTPCTLKRPASGATTTTLYLTWIRRLKQENSWDSRDQSEREDLHIHFHTHQRGSILLENIRQEIDVKIWVRVTVHTDSCENKFWFFIAAWKSASTLRLFWLQCQLLNVAGEPDVHIFFATTISLLHTRIILTNNRK